jgi:hypothetical protein
MLINNYLLLTEESGSGETVLRKRREAQEAQGRFFCFQRYFLEAREPSPCFLFENIR